jgi:hypothetical protein
MQLERLQMNGWTPKEHSQPLELMRLALAHVTHIVSVEYESCFLTAKKFRAVKNSDICLSLGVWLIISAALFFRDSRCEKASVADNTAAITVIREGTNNFPGVFAMRE